MGRFTKKALAEAVESGQADAVRKMLASNEGAVVPLGAANKALANGHVAMVRLGMDLGLHFSAAGFLAAVDAGHTEAVRMLLEGGYRSNLALERAAGGGHLEIVRMLLELKYLSQRAVEAASSNGHVEVVRELVKAGCYVGDSLVLAAREGHERVVHELLPRTTKTYRAVSAALDGEHADILRLLVHKGFNAKHAMEEAVCKRNGSRIGLLIGAGVRTTTAGLVHLAKMNDTDNVRLVLQNIGHISCFPAFNYAVQHRNKEMAALLIDGRAGKHTEALLALVDVENGEDALDRAIAVGDTATARFLLQKGITSKPAVIRAQHAGDYPLVCKLIKGGCPGDSALEDAVLSGDEARVGMLLDAGARSELAIGHAIAQSQLSILRLLEKKLTLRDTDFKAGLNSGCQSIVLFVASVAPARFANAAMSAAIKDNNLELARVSRRVTGPKLVDQAIQYRRLEILDLLLAAGVRNYRAFHRALCTDNKPIIRAFVNAGYFFTYKAVKRVLQENNERLVCGMLCHNVPCQNSSQPVVYASVLIAFGDRRHVLSADAKQRAVHLFVQRGMLLETAQRVFSYL